MPTIEGLGIEIQLPDLLLRTRGLFTDVVPTVDMVYAGPDGTLADRTGFGARWMGRDAYDVLMDTIVGCDEDDTFTSEEIDLVEQDTLPFSYATTMRCSTIGGMGMPEINDWLDDDEMAIRSFAFAAAATTTGTHLNLVDESTGLGAGADMAAAMGLIEQGLGQRIANLRGYVFVPLTLLTEAVNLGAVITEGGEYVTPAGHRVIADAGHTAQNTLYGTGAMAWALSPPVPVVGNDGWFDRGRNRLVGVRQRYGLVAFNPLHSVSATVS
jgi:hypothetical protein